MLTQQPEILRNARQTLDLLRAELLADRGTADHWTGTLSPSCLSTATAISALSLVCGKYKADGVDDHLEVLQSLIVGGVRYCLAGQNGDGGFGDTDRSYSNIATSMLVAAALRLAKPILSTKNTSVIDAISLHADLLGDIERCTARLDTYIEKTGGLTALRQRYGKDKTFVIPILTNCALAGMVDWKLVQALPFELAAVPQSFYRFVRMPVVSYAVPALVAIGQARFFHKPPRILPLRWMRASLIDRTMQVLDSMQPESGGYLEATPLTSFVLMSLAATGRADCNVAQRAVRFLRDSVLEDGSWPIDTNLATWITSLSVHALSCDPNDDRSWADDALANWVLKCQHRERHPFTGAEPGGWGWTDLSGAVPDGDDTPGAIIALAQLDRSETLSSETRQQLRTAVSAGVGWLMRLQNRDGGWPTFCRGWGKLPFDRSSTDLTAHTLRALTQSVALGVKPSEVNGWDAAVRNAWSFLRRRQRADGSLLPLWFGNQDNPDDENPIYGTARLLLASEGVWLAKRFTELPSDQVSQTISKSLDTEILARAAEYLVVAQNDDGGWGGGPSRNAWEQADAFEQTSDSQKTGQNKKNVMQPGLAVASSVEETAVAIEGLAVFLKAVSEPSLEPLWRTGQNKRYLTASGNRDIRASIIRGLAFLNDAVQKGKHQDPWPIGFYFAKLWYHERLYATVYSVAAIGTALSVFEHSSEPPAIEKDHRVVDPHAVRL